MEQNEENCQRWTSLPDDITDAITAHLSLQDILRMSSVCKQWRLVSDNIKRRRSLSSQPYGPMVLFDYNLRNGSFSVYSFEDRKTYSIYIEGSPSVQCFGCFQGWLVLLSTYPYSFFVLNIFTRTRIDLPCLNDFGTNISKVMLLFSPIDITSKETNFDCVIVALNFWTTELSICRLGHGPWTVLKLGGHEMFIGSLVYYKGQIYVMSKTRDLYNINLEGLQPSFRICKVKFPENISSYNHEYEIEPFLVESKENLLMVLRFKKLAIRQTVSFLIYKLIECHDKGDDDSNDAEYMLERVHFLPDDLALFIGRSCSKSVFATECRGVQGNSIYFADDILIKSAVPQFPEEGIYNIKTGNIGPCLPPNDFFLFDHMARFWITPSV